MIMYQVLYPHQLLMVDVMVGFKRITDELKVGFDVYHPLYSFSGLGSLHAPRNEYLDAPRYF